jgi:hypothetical protein
MCLMAAISLAIAGSPQTIDERRLEPPNLQKEALNLGSPSPSEATDAMRTLFEAGAPSLPFLVGQFNNHSEFRGLCGSNILDNDATQIPFEHARSGKRPALPSVREAALYLARAISANDLYAGPSCYAWTRATDADPSPLEGALNEIARLLAEHLSAPSLDAFDAVLSRFNVRFGSGPMNPDKREDKSVERSH